MGTKLVADSWAANTRVIYAMLRLRRFNAYVDIRINRWPEPSIYFKHLVRKADPSTIPILRCEYYAVVFPTG